MANLTLTITLFLAILTTIQATTFANDNTDASKGIATQYQNDKNIATDPDVIFSANFEDGIIGWTQSRNKPAITINKDPAIICGDSACVQITAIHKKDEGGDLSFHLPVPQDQLYVRFYVRFHKDTFMAGHFVNMRALKLQPQFWPNAGSRPPGDKGYWSTICPPYPEKDRSWRFYTYWHEMHSWQNEDGSPNNPPDGDGRSFYGNTFFPFKDPGKFEREKWYCVEFMLKANTSGKHDGEQAAWIDGEKIMHWKTGCTDGIWFRDRFRFSEDWIKNPKPFEGFNWRTDPNLKINIVNFQWWVPDYQSVESTNGICIVYFDDIVIAKKYIGPRVQSQSPEKVKPETPKVDYVQPLKEDPVETLPSVFFFEDFESIKNLEDRFYNVGGRFRISEENAVSGEKGLQLTYIPKEQMEGDPGSAGYAGYFFGDNPLTRQIENKNPYNKVYARWYHKFEDGFEPQPGRGTLPPKMARMRCYGGDWKAIYSVLFWIEGQDGHIAIERHTKAPNIHREWLPNYHTTWGFLNDGNIGRWIYLELCVSLGEGTRSDRIQAWADGMLICDIPNDDLAAGFKELTLNAMQWDCYWNGGSPSSQSRFYDDLVLSTEPIGPVRTGLNPVIVKAAFAGGKGQSQQGWEIEVAQSRQVAGTAAAKDRTPKMEHTVVWKGSVKGDSNTVRVDSRNGEFVVDLVGKAQLANNTLYFVRVRQKSNSGVWSEWSGWHSAFATIWKEDAKPQEKTPPAGFLLEHNE